MLLRPYAGSSGAGGGKNENAQGNAGKVKERREASAIFWTVGLFPLPIVPREPSHSHYYSIFPIESLCGGERVSTLFISHLLLFI